LKTFTIGQDLEIDIRRHVRVDGSRFPTPSPDYVADYFIITARWQGVAIDFYPNQGRPADPLAVGWVGKKVLESRVLISGDPLTGTAVYGPVVLKRGADFRRRMFKMFAHRLGKAVLARQLVKTVSQITDADIAATAPNSRLGRALRGTFPDPVDLMQFGIDNACRHLRDAEGDLEEGDKPPGTVVNIDADFDSYCTSSAEDETGTVVGFGISGAATELRAQLRFPLTSIAGGSTINDSDLQVNVTAQSGTPSGDDVIRIFPYNATGASDPNPDTAATKFSRSIGGTALTTTTLYYTNGSHTVDLTATADGHIAGLLASFYAIALAHLNHEANESEQIETIENAGTDPATLIVDYTAAAGSEGSGTPSLPALTAAASGYMQPNGTGTPTLPKLTASATGNQPFTASGTPSLPSLTASATGVMQPSGTGAPSLPALTAAAEGTHTDEKIGTSETILPQLTASASGYMVPTGTAADTLPALTAAATGQHTQSGSGTPSLPALTASASATHAQSGSGTPSLPALTAASSGLHTQTATGTPSLPQLTASATGATGANTTGTAVVALGLLVMSAAGFTPAVGTSAVTLPGLTFTGRAAPIIRTGYYMRDIRRPFTRRVRPAI
jgi:hypothetical protein